MSGDAGMGYSIGSLVEELAVQKTEGDRSGPPLLQWLRDAVGGGDMGRTRSGAAAMSERAGINVPAFVLWEDITGQIAAQFNGATELRPNRSPEVNLLAWWAVFAAAGDRGELELLQWEVAADRVSRWASRIRDHFDQPNIVPLDVACPICGARRVTTGAGEEEAESFAVQVIARVDHDLIARCHNPVGGIMGGPCGAQWVGDHEVIDLAKCAGLEIDVDAIREARKPIAESAVPA